MDSGKTAETDVTPLGGQQSSSAHLVLPEPSPAPLVTETTATEQHDSAPQSPSTVSSPAVITAEHFVPPESSLTPLDTETTAAEQHDSAPQSPPTVSSPTVITAEHVVPPESSLTPLDAEATAAEQHDPDPQSPSTISSPTIITAPPSYNLNPAIFPEPLPSDARPLNPDGSTPWSVYTIAGVANVVAEGIPMLVNFGFVLPTTLAYLERHNVGARFNFGGFWGDLAQSSSQMVPAAAVLAVSSYLFFTYGTPLTAAGLGGDGVRQVHAIRVRRVRRAT